MLPHKQERVEELLNGLANDAHMLSHGRDLVTGDTLSMLNMQGIALTMRNNIYEVWRLVRGTPAASSLEMSAVSSTVGLAQLVMREDEAVKMKIANAVKKLGDRMFTVGFDWAEEKSLEFSDVMLAMDELGVTEDALNAMPVGKGQAVVEKMVEFGYGMFAYGRNRAANVGG